MYDNKVHSVSDRIVSLSQPYLRPIVRGKAKSPVEFGAKLDISVTDGFVRLEKQSFDACNEAVYLQEVIERYKMRTGSFPQRGWQTKSTVTVTTSTIARNAESDFPAQHWDGRRKMQPSTKSRNMWTFVTAWKWNENSV